MQLILFSLKRVLDEEGGGASVEYALLLAFIFVAIVVAVGILGVNVTSLFTDFNSKYDAATANL